MTSGSLVFVTAVVVVLVEIVVVVSFFFFGLFLKSSTSSLMVRTCDLQQKGAQTHRRALKRAKKTENRRQDEKRSGHIS